MGAAIFVAVMVSPFNSPVSVTSWPACDAIVVWGVNDGESWIPGTFPGYGRALLFDDALARKETYTAVQAALAGS